jgi:hypothetical protein
MFTFNWEVVAPDTYNIGGQDVVLAGIKVTSYHVTKHFDENGDVDEAKTSQDTQRVFVGTADCASLYERFGLDGSKEDRENPDIKQFVGKKVLAQLKGKSEPDRRTPTSEQIAKAKKAGKRPEGDIMKHPVTGKEQVLWKPELVEVFGIAQNPNGGPI